MEQPEMVKARIAFWRKRSAEDGARFRRRWSFGALRKVDADLADALYQQEQFFVAACVTGGTVDIEDHGSALCRGYMAAIKAMEKKPGEN
jgi:hypothetical protein